MQVIIVDECQPHVTALGRAFAELGNDVWITESFEIAAHLAATRRIDVVVSELQVGGRPWTTLLHSLREKGLSASVVVVTGYGSVESAISAIAAGASSYLVKPASAQQVLDELFETDGDTAEDRRDFNLTLDRIVWNLITRTVDGAGSIAEAARRLGVDRRSFRRMLSKGPPPCTTPAELHRSSQL